MKAVWTIAIIGILLLIAAPDLCRTEKCHPTNQVEVVDYEFVPACITISPGTTVTWTNQPGASMFHTVTSDPESTEVFDSGALGSEGTFSYTFNNSGEFGYHCSAHERMGMVGTVKVE